MATAYIGLGSNLGYADRTPTQMIHAACTALAELGTMQSRSSLYQTAPVGYSHQPVFINAVAAIRTALAPAVLLDRLLAIERRFGRDRASGVPNGPRTLDLDLLLLDQLILHTPLLALPHPRLVERRFVLAPLAEIAPGLRHPESGTTMQHLLEQLPARGENAPETVELLPGNG